MELPQVDIVGVIYALLPGFIAAWIFYGLTAHRKSSPFERVVQALIFTGIVQAVVLPLSWGFLLVGNILSIGVWTTDVAFVWSVFFAVLLGTLFSLCANKDWFHGFLRNLKLFGRIEAITTRTSYPSEWFSAFSHEKRYVVLHLTGERRLYGWPYEWPDAPDSGHFVIVEPEWLLANNERAPLHTVDKMLIPAKEVLMVEFEKYQHELVDENSENISSVEKTLITLQKSNKP